MSSPHSRDHENSTGDKERMTSLGCLPYRDLIGMLREVKLSVPQEAFERNTTTDKPCVELPEDLCVRIVKFLVVKAVKPGQVSISQASSKNGVYPLRSVFQNDQQLWSSAQDTMPNGRGEEFLQFRLGPRNQTRRVRSCFVTIPRRPDAVCEFRIDVSSDDGTTWEEGDPTMYTSPIRDEMCRFDLPDMDAKQVRFVCLSNMSANDEDHLDDLPPHVRHFRWRHSTVTLQEIAFG